MTETLTSALLTTMKTLRHSRIDEKTLLGDFAVYPGHPITVAFLIMHRYECLSDATKKSPNSEYSMALTDSEIPGAGGCVYSAIAVLDELKESANPSDLFTKQSEHWISNKYDHPEKRVLAQKQADGIKEAFIAKASSWNFN